MFIQEVAKLNKDSGEVAFQLNAIEIWGWFEKWNGGNKSFRALESAFKALFDIPFMKLCSGAAEAELEACPLSDGPVPSLRGRRHVG